MADTTFAPPPPPAVPQGWEPRWSDEYKTWFYVNTLSGASSWELPAHPVYPDAGSVPSMAPPPEQQVLQSPYTPMPTPGSEVPSGLGHPGFANPGVPTPGSEYPGPAGGPDFANPAAGEGEGDGERGLFGPSNPNGQKHGMLGKVALGVGAVALLGGAVHEWDKHFGANSQQQQNNPPPQQTQGTHWWQTPVLPNFGPPLPNQQQNQSQGSFFSSPFSAFGGGGGEVTGPGACPNGPGEVHDHNGSWTYNLTFNQPVINSAQQTEWRVCRKCLVLNWTGNGVGPCAGGGRHDNGGSRNYRLDSTDQGQKNWRFCNKCHSLGYNGKNDLGKCPGGGVHDHQGSWDFGLLHDGEGGQDRWKWCRKCMQLAFDGYH